MTKTMSFAVVHFTVAFSVGYLMTGSVLVGGAIALVEPAINTVAFHIHEQAWNRVKQARQAQANEFVINHAVTR
jgi:uncharacterized membrane protein